MQLPTIVLMPSINAAYPCPGGTYVSNVNGYIFNVLATDIPTLTGVYGGVTVAPRNNTSASSNPQNTNDFTQLYGPGSLWLNTAAVTLWMCTTMGTVSGTAVWTEVAAVAGGSPTITLGGDVTGSGTSSITVTLDTVNSNVGRFESLTVNGKGLVTAATALSGYGTTSSGVLTVTKVKGTTAGGNAAAGDVGEYLSTVVLIASEISINNAPANVCTLSLTAGDWDVNGELWVDTATGSATVSGKTQVAITTTTGTLPTVPADNSAKAMLDNMPFSVPAPEFILPVGLVRISLSGTTNVFLVGFCATSAGTAYGYGKLCARRVR